MPDKNLNQAVQKTLTKLLGLASDGKIGWMTPPVIPTVVTSAQYMTTLPALSIITAAVNATSATTYTGVALRMTLYPFTPAKALTVDQILVECSTLLASSTARIGVYSDVLGVPTTLLAGGTVLHDCSTTGVKTEPMNYVFTPGTTYWLACVTSGTQALRALSAASMLPLGLSTTAGAPANVRQVTLGSMVLPSTCPATTIAAASPPMVRLRVA